MQTLNMRIGYNQRRGAIQTATWSVRNNLLFWQRISRQIKLALGVHFLTGDKLRVRTILLLTISNIFMTFAWYGHLKYRSEALWKVILASWGIAFFEYCFQVPANRIGSFEFTTAQLKTIQEVITLTVFAVFSMTYLGEKLRWNYAAGFACICLAVFFVFHKW